MTDDSAQDLVRENAMALLNEQWDIVEKRLAGQRWPLGDRLSCADIYLVMVATCDFALGSSRCKLPARLPPYAAPRPPEKFLQQSHSTLCVKHTDQSRIRMEHAVCTMFLAQKLVNDVLALNS